MPFWMLDDRANANRKIKALTARVLLYDDLTGVAALGMWALGGAESQVQGTDGLLSIADLVGIVPDRTVAETLAHLLVDAELWHGHGHECTRCRPVPERHWLYHDWFDLRYKRGVDMRTAWAKAKEGKRTEIVNAVWLRDCVDPAVPARSLTAHCRYCTKLVRRSDHTSDDAPQIDHVDPKIAIGARNLVVSCGPCNRRKAARTPEEAGMTLRPAPRTLIDPEPTTALADAVSPGTPAAETPADAAVTEPAADPGARSQPEASRKASQKATSESVPARTRRRGPGGAPGSGTGLGLGLGSGEGSAPGSPARPAPSSSARRRRGRGGRPKPGPPTPQQRNPHDAGPAPLAYPAPTGGSPWMDWTGPPSPISDENVCPTHHRHAPCDKCAARGEAR